VRTRAPPASAMPRATIGLREPRHDRHPSRRTASSCAERPRSPRRWPAHAPAVHLSAAV